VNYRIILRFQEEKKKTNTPQVIQFILEQITIENGFKNEK
jgi:hypothetical protein